MFSQCGGITLFSIWLMCWSVLLQPHSLLHWVSAYCMHKFCISCRFSSVCSMVPLRNTLHLVVTFHKVIFSALILSVSLAYCPNQSSPPGWPHCGLWASLEDRDAGGGCPGCSLPRCGGWLSNHPSTQGPAAAPLRGVGSVFPGGSLKHFP